MIVPHYHGPSVNDWAYYPVEDSIPLRTWRPPLLDDLIRRERGYTYPTEGCHGAPLTQPCSCQGWSQAFRSDGWICVVCRGSGEQRADAPNRTDIP